MPSLKVFLAHESYYPGNIVEGVVELSVGKGESVAYNSIRLSLTGKERNRHQVSGKKVDGKEVRSEDQERNLFFKEVIVLAGEMVDGNDTVGRTVNEGIYRYPFAYKLPNNIPSSLSVSFGKTDFAEILYQAKATVIKPRTAELSKEDAKLAKKEFSKTGMVLSKPIRALKTQRYFHVLRPMPLSQYNDKKSIVTETPFHLQACGCCDAGNQIQYIDIDRSVIAIDRDILQIVINVDNTASKKAVTGMQVKLKRNFKWRCNDYTKVAADETVSKETFKIGVEAGAKGVLSGICPVPQNLVPSCKTFNINCTYELHIKVFMSGCADQEHTHPITIVQSVDDTNTVEKIVFNENAYTNVIAAYVKAGAYAAPSASTLLNFNPIPTDVPSGKPSTVIGAVNESALMLPSSAWQQWEEKKDLRRAHVEGNALKYETMVWTGGLRQKQLAPIVKPSAVKFRVANAAADKGHFAMAPSASGVQPAPAAPTAQPAASTAQPAVSTAQPPATASTAQPPASAPDAHPPAATNTAASEPTVFDAADQGK